MDEKVKEAIRFVFSYAKDVTDWKTIKKELLKFLPAEQRKLFSTRDARTKKQIINEFEEAVIKEWQELTGTNLYLDKP